MSTIALIAPLLLASADYPQTHASAGAQEAGAVDVVTTTDDRHNRMTVPVRIGDKGPYRFLIDTGAENTVLSTDLAARLALVPSARAKLIGVAGSQMVDTVEIDEIELGQRNYYGLLAPLLEAENIGADGIVGIDSLQGQRVLLDFRKKLIAIGDAKTLGGNRGYEIVVTARKRSGQLIMTDAKIDGVSVQVVIDTGAETSIGNLALQRSLARRRQGETTTLHGVTGHQIQANIGYASSLTINSINVNNLLIAYADAPVFTALELDKKPALLLGMRELRLFNRVAIDFSTRRVLFDLPHGVL